MPWSILDKDQVEGKVKIPSTLTTAFVQYTTEELDQLDQPQHPQRKGQEGEQYLTVPPLVYGITPQESLAGGMPHSQPHKDPSVTPGQSLGICIQILYDSLAYQHMLSIGDLLVHTSVITRTPS